MQEIMGKYFIRFFHASEDIRKTFEINPISAEVHLRSQLDLKQYNFATINIQATDGGVFPKNALFW